LQRNSGWIESLLKNAYNEQMCLLTFTITAKAGWFVKPMVLTAQGVFANDFVLAYLISPSLCHRFKD